MAKKFKFKNIENLLAALNWRKATELVLYDTDLRDDINYFHEIFNDLSGESKSRINIYHNHKCKYPFKHPTFTLKLGVGHEITLFYNKSTKTLSVFCVIMIYLKVRYWLKNNCKYQIYLISIDGSDFSLNGKNNYNLPKLVAEPHWAMIKRKFRNKLKTLQDVLSIRGFILVT